MYIVNTPFFKATLRLSALFLLLTTYGQAQDCPNEIVRAVSSVTYCQNGKTVGIYLNPGGPPEFYPFTGTFTEYEDGTGRLLGEISLGSVDVEFTERIPISNAYLPQSCNYPYTTDDWYRYTDFSGKVAHFDIWPVPGNNSKFQIGSGASLHNSGYGAAGWFNYKKQNGHQANGEFFLAISDEPGPECFDDTDNDGKCDCNDCAPNDPNLPAMPGTTCDDGNAQTVYDHVQGDGCSCQGTPKPCDGKK